MQTADTLQSSEQPRIASHQQTQQGVGMAGKELRTRVQHQIGAQVEGALQQRSRKGAVHDRGRHPGQGTTDRG